MGINSDVARLQQLTRQLAVFSPDSIALMKQSLPMTRFKSEIISVLAANRSSLLTSSIHAKFTSVKQGLIPYLEAKISKISAENEECDPWILLKNHFSKSIDVSPINISDHLQDVLEATRLIAKYEFSLGAAAQSNEVLLLRNALVSAYLPALHTLDDSGTKDAILNAIEDIDALLLEMNSQLKAKKYKETLESHEKVQAALQKSCLAARGHLASRTATSYLKV